MAIVTGDRYLEKLVKFVELNAGPLIDGATVLKLNPAGLHYVQSRLEALHELESLLAGAPVDYLRAYVSDLGDHRALEQLRRILRLLTSLKVVSVLPPPTRDPTPLSLLPFGRLKLLELRGCDLSTSAARGLLELRHTLEKIICHNSTDALRHVFASRIAEIKDSPQWNRLSFVSCACNRLVLMDESLQLLPAVETLDLSRNRFAKVDNLRKCTKLKHLDLGFNHLRTISCFSEVSCHIVKLVLRNNALTALRGIEKLKSLEGLDVSYNIISNFSELDFLAGLLSLRSLWMEGNPLCCARWYRAQVFSYFAHPDRLKLDDKEISTRELWKRQLIIARRQKRPSSFGFYSPAKDEAEGEGNINIRRRKVSRLALIESEEESTYVYSDHESASCDNEIQSKEENHLSDDEAEIVDLMNRVELMKKERSVLWLREFKDWMDHASENCADGSHYSGSTLHPGKENYLKNKKGQRHLGESSRYVSDSVHASGDDSSTNVLESDHSFTDMSTGLHSNQYFDHIGKLGIVGGVSLPGMEKIDLRQENQTSHSREGINRVFMHGKGSHPDAFMLQVDQKIVQNFNESALTASDDRTESRSSSVYHGSPPHYQKDILHRRHNLVEEILQLSAESYSVASSDSDTSSSDHDFCACGLLMSEVHESLNQDYLDRTVGGNSTVINFENSCVGHQHEISLDKDNGVCTTSEEMSTMLTLNNLAHPARGHTGEITDFVDHETDWLEQRKNRKKQRRRVISLLEEKNMVDKREILQESNGNLYTFGAHGEDVQRNEILGGSNFQKDEVNWDDASTTSLKDDGDGFSGGKSSLWSHEFIEEYFSKNIADSTIHETCSQYICCNCVFEPDSMCREREVVLILSSRNKLYVLVAGAASEGSGTILSLLACHSIKDIKEVLLGIGLQVVRVSMVTGSTYLFITRDGEKSGQLLCTLQVFDSCGTKHRCSLRSLEQVQVQLFENQICGGLKFSIFQYCMVLFCHNTNEEELWLSRSVFVIGGHLLVCNEDLRQFGSLSQDASSSYFSLDSCCFITDVSEMVIEARESHCLTLALERASSKFRPSAKVNKRATVSNKHKTASGLLRWKIKWLSEESLFKFVALLEAIHSRLTTYPLIVKRIS